MKNIRIGTDDLDLLAEFAALDPLPTTWGDVTDFAEKRAEKRAAYLLDINPDDNSNVVSFSSPLEMIRLKGADDKLINYVNIFAGAFFLKENNVEFPKTSLLLSSEPITLSRRVGAAINTVVNAVVRCPASIVTPEITEELRAAANYVKDKDIPASTNQIMEHVSLRLGGIHPTVRANCEKILNSVLVGITSSTVLPFSKPSP
jgi:hypothetical protein